MLSSAATTARTPPRRYKLVLLGESGVGKSSLAQRLVKNEWSAMLNSTVGASFFRYACPLDEHDGNNNNSSSSAGGSSRATATAAASSPVLFDIWDTAGQERYRSLASMYYRGAAAAVVVYEITSRETFEQAKYWVQELCTSSPDTIVALVGNKTDLASARRVRVDEARAYAAEHDLLVCETSAKDGSGVREAFALVARRLVERSSSAVVRDGGVLASPSSSSLTAATANTGGARTCCA